MKEQQRYEIAQKLIAEELSEEEARKLMCSIYCFSSSAEKSQIRLKNLIF